MTKCDGKANCAHNVNIAQALKSSGVWFDNYTLNADFIRKHESLNANNTMDLH